MAVFHINGCKSKFTFIIVTKNIVNMQLNFLMQTLRALAQFRRIKVMLVNQEVQQNSSFYIIIGQDCHLMLTPLRRQAEQSHWALYRSHYRRDYINSDSLRNQ